MARILVVEDEVRLASALARGLESRGWDVTVAHDGHTGYRLAKQADFDVLVLDVMLPGTSGLDVCRRLRAEDVWTPILVLTAMDAESFEADVLDSGADDYLRKPFSYQVLVARCGALLRRGPAVQAAEIRIDDLALHPAMRTVRRGDVPIELTRREFALLEYLMRNAGQVRSKEEILEHVWGSSSHHDPNVVEVYIGYLRRKVDQPFSTSTVRTLRGRGYLLEARRAS